jgi:hypothetical protein
MLETFCMSTFNLAVTGLSAAQWEVALWLLRAAGIVAALLVLTLALRHWRLSNERDAQRVFEQLDLLRSELLLIQENMERQSQTAASSAQAPAAMRTSQTQMEPRNNQPLPAMPAPRGYEVAVRLARSGATVDELISSCGLSRHEAQLVLRLHGRQESVPAVKREANIADAKTRARSSDAPSRPSVNKEPPARARLSMVG